MVTHSSHDTSVRQADRQIHVRQAVAGAGHTYQASWVGVGPFLGFEGLVLFFRNRQCLGSSFLFPIPSRAMAHLAVLTPSEDHHGRSHPCGESTSLEKR